MADDLDLKTLSIRESEQVEWKENVADTDDAAETLSAFANDWSNLGGGCVVCGAKEEKDEHGFPWTISRASRQEKSRFIGASDRPLVSVACDSGPKYSRPQTGNMAKVPARPGRHAVGLHPVFQHDA
ncbi:MAG TPA: RNA-binding domain-containing protein [Acidobacteriaceae bacterium]|nr:RNA-binding domain-containing protein [Acidobacteriaceae bacterium]